MHIKSTAYVQVTFIYSFIRNKCRIKKKKERKQTEKIHIKTKLNEQNVSV